MNTILFFHGFRGVGKCEKSIITKEICSEYNLNVIFPDLEYSTDEFDKDKMFEKYFLSDINVVGCVGISLGGLYARWFNDQFNIPALVINSRFENFQDVVTIGEHKKYSNNDVITIKEDYYNLLPIIEKSVNHTDLEFIEFYLSEYDNFVSAELNYDKYIEIEPNHTHILKDEKHGISNTMFEMLLRRWIYDHKIILFD